ncbi:MAG: hypothetical protein EXR70_18425 [Deltaproteobacteria bacterium]|nr:hypothetical protein [Deltaproteobacteria bacterium]
MKKFNYLFIVLSVLSGCASGTLSREATLLSGLQQYQGEMQRSGGNVSNWPNRQRAANELKTIITGTLGGSGGFYRLVDLDQRKREFVVTIRETNLQADRLKEMQDELARIEDEIAGLRPVLKTQLTAIAQGETAGTIESIATLGLLGIAIDGFSSSGAGRGIDGLSTKVGQYLVGDLGSFATVRTPQGQTHRCSLFGNSDEGAGILCQPVK